MPKLSTIRGKAFTKQKSLLARVNQFGDLEINTVTMGNPEKFARLKITEQRLYGSEGRDLYNKLLSNKDSLTPRQLREIDMLGNRLKYSREMVGDSIKSVIDHEMMHHYSHGSHLLESDARVTFKSAWRQATGESLKSEYKYKISAYGGEGVFDKVEEHIAESYAAYRLGETGNIHPQLLKFFRENLK